MIKIILINEYIKTTITESVVLISNIIRSMYIDDEYSNDYIQLLTLKIKLFFKYLLDTSEDHDKTYYINQKISDDDICKILFDAYQYDDTNYLFELLLELKFYPLDIKNLDQVDNIKFKNYVKLHMTNIKLVDRNDFLEQTLLCIPGGEYAQILKQDFENLIKN